MQYLKIEDLIEKQPGSSFRGPHRVVVHRGGSVVGRRYWMRKRIKRYPVNPEQLRYEGLIPRRSSFEAVTEACLLNAPQMTGDDIRRDNPDFKPEAKTSWGDPNYGPPVFTKGIKEFHGDGCTCYECVGYPKEGGKS